MPSSNRLVPFLSKLISILSISLLADKFFVKGLICDSTAFFDSPATFDSPTTFYWTPAEDHTTETYNARGFNNECAGSPYGTKTVLRTYPSLSELGNYGITIEQ